MSEFEYDEENGLSAINKLDHLKMLAEIDFPAACVWALNNIDSLKQFHNTWCSYCGASKTTFIAHTVRMLINIDKQLADNSEQVEK